jgi:serine/threonine protein kinase
MADDAATLGQQAQMLGLVTETQVRECFEEVDPHRRHGAADMVRVLERKGYLTPWQSQKLLKGDRDGYFLGGYRLLYRISSGTFGRVYRADDPKSGVVVAIKVLRKRWSDDPHSIELFEREGKLGLTLRHPAIVQTLAVDKDSTTGQHFMVMEFVEGGNLRDLLAIRKKFAPAEILPLMEEAAIGLAHAYSKGMTHRDLKLTNVLISSQGKAKLVDFGLANIMAAATTAHPDDDTRVERTVDYAGLEKATGVKAGDVRSDIFFLGCMLYECLAGRSPLEVTKNKAARMQKQRFLSVEPLTPEEVQAPPGVFRLLDMMMALDPLKRFQTPAQLVEAIREVRRELEGKATSSTEISLSGRTMFVVESNERLRDVIRDKFKELGFRVLISGDPERAFQRFQQQPFDIVIVDAGSVGEPGLVAFRQILGDATRLKLSCAGVLMLSEEQRAWAERVDQGPHVAVLVRPITMKQLLAAACQVVGGQKV